MALNLAVGLAFAVSFLLRLGDIDDSGEVGTGLIALSVVALAALARQGGWTGS